MSAKKVSISGKPTKKATAPKNADEWVADAAPMAEPAATGKMKRLTIDIPEELHKNIKAQCAMRGTKIADEMRELLSQKYRKL